jgi:hypothetical protein
MMSASIKPFMSSDDMLNVVMASVVAPYFLECRHDESRGATFLFR